jgi:hypothetical protein
MTSCGVIYNKREFKKITNNQSNNGLIKKNGYYFHERISFIYENSEGEYSANDSIKSKSITGIIFYKDGKAYVRKGYSYRIKDNSLNIAQEEFEKEIEKYNLKKINKDKSCHFSTLGKYSIKNDTIIINFFRHSQGDRLLTELKGIIRKENEFHILQMKDFQRSGFWIFKTKPEIYKISEKYRFEEY